MLDLRRLRYACVLARSGSYVGAAQALGVTQPALTRSIQSLEAELGLRLFDRGRGGVVPTEAGLELVAKAEQVLFEVQSIKDAVAAQRTGAAGKVRVGVGPLIASVIMEQVLPSILADFRAIELRVDIAGGAALQERIAANDLHFAICAAETVSAGENFTITPLGSLALWLLARSGHPLGGSRVARADLAPFPLIGGSGTGRADMPGHYRPQLVCDNFEILRAVTLASDSVWVASPAAASAALSEGRLIRVDCPEMLSGHYEVVMVARRRRTLSKAALVVQERLLAALAPHFV